MSDDNEHSAFASATSITGAASRYFTKVWYSIDSNKAMELSDHGKEVKFLDSEGMLDWLTSKHSADLKGNNTRVLQRDSYNSMHYAICNYPVVHEDTSYSDIETLLKEHKRVILPRTLCTGVPGTMIRAIEANVFAGLGHPLSNLGYRYTPIKLLTGKALKASLQAKKYRAEAKSMLLRRKEDVMISVTTSKMIKSIRSVIIRVVNAVVKGSSAVTGLGKGIRIDLDITIDCLSYPSNAADVRALLRLYNKLEKAYPSIVAREVKFHRKLVTGYTGSLKTCLSDTENYRLYNTSKHEYLILRDLQHIFVAKRKRLTDKQLARVLRSVTKGDEERHRPKQEK